MTLTELAQHLTREELAAFGVWPDASEQDKYFSDDCHPEEELN